MAWINSTLSRLKQGFNSPRERQRTSYSGGKTFCSPFYEASFTNCWMIEGQDATAGPDGYFIAAIRYP